MKEYTAIYDSETMKGIQYYFKAVDGNKAKEFCHRKFSVDDIMIRDEQTGEVFPMVDEYLNDKSYVSRCMNSGIYNLYILYTWGDNGKATFAPVIELTKEQTKESTHKIGKWFVNFEAGNSEEYRLTTQSFCEKNGNLIFEKL